MHGKNTPSQSILLPGLAKELHCKARFSCVTEHKILLPCHTL